MEYKSFVCKNNAWQVFRAFSKQPHAFLLESSLREPHLGRYSMMGCQPFEFFSSSSRNALQDLKDRYNIYARDSRQPGTLPFTAGITGYISYDYGRTLEKISSQWPGTGIPDVCFGFYDCVVLLDHLAGRLYVVSSGFPERVPSLRAKRARERLKAMTALLRQTEISPGRERQPPGQFFPSPSGVKLEREMTSCQYQKSVKRALDYIRKGDIYQVNLSQRFFVNGKMRRALPEALPLYEKLRVLSPSCFSAYFDGGAFQIVSSSPERFLRLRKRQVVTRPMKGTRARGRTRQQDRQNRRKLLDSKKEKAELLMITDLERNDLGRVCEYGSVRVDALRTLESYATVFQATSTISGRLKDSLDGFDLLQACLPGGSITGCPKIRAMQIIDELEVSRRSIYTGVLGYMDFNGDLDFNILIRTLLVRPRTISFHVGAGIVSDSKPEAEYEETIIKAQAMSQCLQTKGWRR